MTDLTSRAGSKSDALDDPGRTPGRGTTMRISRWQMMVGAIGAVVVLWVGGDLFDIVTSGGSRPVGGEHRGVPDSGGRTPPGADEPPNVPGPGGRTPPPGAHDPSNFGH